MNTFKKSIAFVVLLFVGMTSVASGQNTSDMDSYDVSAAYYMQADLTGDMDDHTVPAGVKLNVTKGQYGGFARFGFDDEGSFQRFDVVGGPVFELAQDGKTTYFADLGAGVRHNNFDDNVNVDDKNQFILTGGLGVEHGKFYGSAGVSHAFEHDFMSNQTGLDVVVGLNF